MATPIFVLGKQRSGTTWLANQLCEHSLIAGVQHKKHFGIKESTYFTAIYDRYGDLTEKNDYIEFVEVLAASDYCSLAGTTKEFLYSLWPTTYGDAFRYVMDDYASRNGATAWVEKTPIHSLKVNQLASLYPDAKFVAIVRDPKSAVASTVARQAEELQRSVFKLWSRSLSIFRSVLSWTYYNKTLNDFGSRSTRMLIVSYESMRANPSNTLKDVCSSIGVPFEAEMCNQRFAVNTSFRSKEARDEALSSTEIRLVSILRWLFAFVPLWALRAFDGLNRNKKRSPLPPTFFMLKPFSEENAAETESVTSPPQSDVV